METKKYIEHLKNKRRTEANVAMRQALCYYLYNENIPTKIIASSLGITKQYVYAAIKTTKDFLEIGDKTALQCMEEVKLHKLRIAPVTVDGAILSKHIGYRLIIDNVIL